MEIPVKGTVYGVVAPATFVNEPGKAAADLSVPVNVMVTVPAGWEMPSCGGVLAAGASICTVAQRSERGVDSGRATQPSSRIEATTLASMVFLNRGDRFEAIPLPAEAQFAPGYGVVVADFDGDGFQDLFLSQNFFDTGPPVPRLDAGRGLLLRGDGTGKFITVPASESGLYIYARRGAPPVRTSTKTARRTSWWRRTAARRVCL